MNIRLKIILLFTLLVTSILTLISYSIYYFTERNREESFRIRVKGGAIARARLFSVLDKDNTENVLGSLDSSTSVIPHRAVVIIDMKQEILYEFYSLKTKKLPITDAVLSEIKSSKEKFFVMNDMDVAATFYSSGGRDFIVFFGGRDDDGHKRQQELARTLIIALLGGVALIVMVGVIFSAQLVKPINRLIEEVNEISASNFSNRIYSGKSQDELSRLAETFNKLLNRLQESFNIQRRFISNASHELSTPLTSISSQLQVTLQKDRDNEEYKKVLYSIQEDVEQMRKLTKSLLEIAKTGYEGSIELTEVRIDEVMFRVIADVKKLNSLYEIELDFGEFPEDEKECMVFGNPDLLYSAIKNIAENGCKYSPDKTSRVALAFRNKQVIIEIKNHGDIIAEEEIEQIFQPFYRASHTSNIKGFGLGLALSRRIVALHKGNILVQSDIKTGTTFTITFPSRSALTQ